MKTRVHIIDNTTGQAVEAEIFDEVTVEHFIETQQHWRPIVLKAARQLAARGSHQLIPQHFHWDWTTKAPDLKLLANSFFGLRCDNRLQGLMKLETVGQFCSGRLPSKQAKHWSMLITSKLRPGISRRWRAPWVKSLGTTP